MMAGHIYIQQDEALERSRFRAEQKVAPLIISAERLQNAFNVLLVLAHIVVMNVGAKRRLSMKYDKN